MRAQSTKDIENFGSRIVLSGQRVESSANGPGDIFGEFVEEGEGIVRLPDGKIGTDLILGDHGDV